MIDVVLGNQARNLSSDGDPASRAPTHEPHCAVEDARVWARRELAGSSSPGLDADVLHGHVLGRDRSWILAHGDEAMTPGQSIGYIAAVERRRHGEPVAYVRGF